MVSPLLDQELGNQDVTGEAGDAITELPNGCGVQAAVFLRDLLDDKVGEGLISVADGLVVSAPGIDGKAVLLGKEVLEECHIRRIEGRMHHALETNILVEPDRPAEAILETR